jgi:hypothetical protein
VFVEFEDLRVTEFPKESYIRTPAEDVSPMHDPVVPTMLKEYPAMSNIGTDEHCVESDMKRIVKPGQPKPFAAP